MNEATEELYQAIRSWAAKHELSSLQIVVILSKMIGVYESAAFEMADEDHKNTVTK